MDIFYNSGNFFIGLATIFMAVKAIYAFSYLSPIKISDVINWQVFCLYALGIGLNAAGPLIQNESSELSGHMMLIGCVLIPLIMISRWHSNHYPEELEEQNRRRIR